MKYISARRTPLNVILEPEQLNVKTKIGITGHFYADCTVGSTFNKRL
jgi:hypothetical protein